MKNKFSSNKNKWLLFAILLISLTGFNYNWSPPPGLFNTEAIAPFLNGNLPDKAPEGNIVTSPIYANIQWESPIVATPFPQSNNMLIVEMDGRFFTLSNNENTTARTTVLDIQARTWYYDWSGAGSKHGGIQNVVFHPQFGLGQGKDYIYVYYLHHPNDNTNSASASSGYYDRLSRFTWQNGSFNPNSELIMINQYDVSRGHDGSGLTFDNDGFLYISVGDEGSQNAAATAHTQKLDDRFRSGVWRIDVDQQGGNISHPINRQPSNANVPAGQTASYTQGYYIPNDNPWVNPNGSTLEEFYAIGLRQPFRMTLDPPTGNFWIGDVGSQQREEIDLMDAPGLNFEWNYKEGTADGFRDLPNPYIGTARPPIYDFVKSGSMAIIGGYVYRGNNIPQLNGKYIFGNNGTGEIFSLSHTVGNSNDGVELIATTADQGSLFNGISSFGQDLDNELLVLKLGSGVAGNGKIYRLTENTATILQEFPDQLSETGIFSNLNNLTPVQGIIPYEVNNPLWSAGTVKKRWVAIPNDGNVNSANEQIDYSENGNWGFPIGTVFIKHFEQPDGKKLETRVWIHGIDGKWFGTTYKWNNAGTNASLLLAGLEEDITIDGETFTYLYPSITQCQTCHTENSGSVLGFRTHQLNKDIFYPTSGLTGNQLETFAQLGFIPDVNTSTVITSYANGDNAQSLEVRARSYFDSNCSHCHQPNGNRAFFDARYNTPLAQQELINGELIEDLGIAGGKVIVPQHLDLSVLYQRINSTEGCCAMPPLAKGRIDKEGVKLVANWINSLEADCTNSSATILGNTLSDGNFIDGHKPALNINKSDIYTNSTNTAKEICLVDFSFYARREGNPVTPFIVKVNGNNDFTILAIGETRTSNVYNVGNNSFPFSSHSDNVIILQPGETIATGFMDAYPDGSGGNTQSVIPAQSAAGEDNVWQTYTTNSQLPSITLGKAPGQAASVANLTRTYKFNIGIEVGEVSMPTNTIDCNNPQNLAIGKTAFQSSTYANSTQYSAANAIDGNTNGVHTAGSMTHTNFDQNAWWEIDLGKVYDLSNVKLWNRTNCCADRLSDFHVFVSDEPFNTQVISTTITQSGVNDFYFEGTAGTETNIDLNRTGRYLRIQLSGTNALQLAEVEIIGCDVVEPINCSNSENITAGKMATQSSTWADNINGADAANAIDGNNNGAYFSGSITHTLFDQNAWWEIDLGTVHDLSTIKIWNRTDCCADRLSDFHVLVSDDPFSTQILTTTINQNGVSDFHFSGTADRETDIELNRTGRYLRIQLSGTNALQLAEVEVLGCSQVGTLYADCGYGGESISLDEGEYPNITNIGFTNDALSSISVPDGFQIILYQHYNFGGSSITLTVDDDCLDNDSFDNNCSSLKIIRLPDNSTPPICQCASGENSILINGSFEETSNPAYNSAYDLVEDLGFNNSGVKFVDKHTDSDFPGWFTTGGIALQQGGFSQGGTIELGQSGFLGLEAPDGSIFVEMDGNNHNQIIAVTPGQFLDWELTHRGREVGIDEISVSAGPVGNQTVIANLSSPNTEWVTHSGQYQVPSGVTQIQLTITPTGASNGDIDSSNLLDNVKVCPSNSNTASCGGATLITYGNGSIKMEGGSFFQILDQGYGPVYNCGFQCESSVTVNGLAAGDYHVYIKDNSYQIICEQKITLSANTGGDPDNDGDGVPASQDCNDNDANLTTTGATCDDGNNNTENDIILANCTCVGTDINTGSNTTTCGDLVITYGEGTIDFEGLANNEYFFKVNDLNDNWAVVGSCSWNCGNQFTVNDLHNSNYLLTVYNTDWSIHCDTEIEMTGAALRSTNQNLYVSPHFGQKTNLQWYFLQTEDRKVSQYIIRHGTVNFEEMTTIERIPATGNFNVETYDFLHKTPELGTNFYQVVVEYEEGSLDYSMNGEITFDTAPLPINIAPNPTQNSLKIDLSNYLNESIDYMVNTIQGNNLLDGTYDADHAGIVELDLKKIPNGLYILYLNPDEHRAIALKFVIAKDY